METWTGVLQWKTAQRCKNKTSFRKKTLKFIEICKQKSTASVLSIYCFSLCPGKRQELKSRFQQAESF